jgi:hypothetical protein
MGCLVQLLGLIIGSVILYAVGGSFRTDVKITTGATGQGGAATFEESFTARHWLGGLIKGEQPDLQAVVARHVGGGKQLGELDVDFRHSFGNCMVTLFTIGIYSPTTVTVRGSVVTTEGPTSPAAPSAEAPPAVDPSAGAPREEPVEMRTWTDETGQHETQAKFLDFENGIVSLERPDGKEVSIAIERLSAQDQEWVRAQSP